MGEMNISQVLLPEMTILDRETFTDKAELFSVMSKKFEECGIVTDAAKFEQALYAREEEGPTYFGNFLAIPHGICDEVVKPGVGFCRVKTPFLYRSNDEEGEVKYIFVMAITGKGGRENHLEILASTARLLAHEEFLEALAEVQSYEELMDAIKKTQQEVED